MKNNNIYNIGFLRQLKRVILCGFLLSFPCCARTGDVPLFETPEWEMNPEYKVGILLRRENNAAQESALLIKHETKEPFVRRYDPRSKTISVVSPETWDATNAPIARCEEQFAPDTRLLAVNPETKRLTDERGDVVPTKGENILNLVWSPQKKRVAVLSAGGAAGSEYSILPFGSGSGASGQYWHQVYSLETRKMESSAIRIPTKQGFTSLRACWSADGAFVVYYEVTFSFLSVVHVD